jgi:hypothetical protein
MNPTSRFPAIPMISKNQFFPRFSYHNSVGLLTSLLQDENVDCKFALLMNRDSPVNETAQGWNTAVRSPVYIETVILATTSRAFLGTTCPPRFMHNGKY